MGDDGITLLCCVHPDRAEDKTTMTHHQITQRLSTVKLSLTQSGTVRRDANWDNSCPPSHPPHFNASSHSAQL